MWRKIAGILLAGASLALFVVSSSMTLDYGASMGLTEHGKWQGAAATFALHAATLAVAALLGTFASWRGIVSAIFLSALLAVCATFTILNLSGYGAKERIEKAMLADARKQALDKATAAANARVTKERSDILTWFKQTHVQTRDKTERKDLRKEALEIVNKGAKIEVQQVETVMSDPQATVFARLTGLDPLMFQIGWWVVAGALFLVLESVFAFYSARLLRPVAVSVPKVVPPVSNQGGGTPSSGNETTGIGSSGGGSNVVKLPAQRAAPNAAVETVSKAQDTGSESRIETDTNPPLEQSQWQDWDDEEPDADDLREVAEDQAIVAKPSRRHRHGEGKKRQWTRAQLKEFMELNDGVPNGDALKKYCDEQRRKNRDGTFAISRSTAWRAINDHKRKHPHDAVEARLSMPIPKRPPSTPPKLGRGLASLMGVKSQQENGHAPY